jgi:hypothetical protein
MAVTCPHCGQQTVLDAAAAAPAPAAEPAPTQAAPAEPAAQKLVARPTATAAKPVAAKPLSEAQKAAIAAARASNPVSRTASAKPVNKKSVVIKTQWADDADGAEDVPPAKPVRCDFCGTKVPPGATNCPDCDTAVNVPLAEEVKPSWFRRIGLGLVFILALVAAGRWGQYYLSLRTKEGKGGRPLKDAIELLYHKQETQPGTALSFVRGAVTNHSAVPWFDVKVECELLDKNGVSLGKFSDSKILLEPHKLFPFNISLLDPDAKSYTNLTVTAVR